MEASLGQGTGTDVPEYPLIRHQSEGFKLVDYLFSFDAEGWHEYTPDSDPDIDSQFLSGYSRTHESDGTIFAYAINREKNAFAKRLDREPGVALKVGVVREGQEDLPIEDFLFQKGTPEFDYLDAILTAIPVADRKAKEERDAGDKVRFKKKLLAAVEARIEANESETDPEGSNYPDAPHEDD